MRLYFQEELNHKFSNYAKPYIFSLLMVLGKKNCLSMSRETKIKKHIYYNFLDREEKEINLLNKYLIDSAKKALSEPGSWYIAIDDSLIHKPFSKKIELVGIGWSGVFKKPTKGITIVAATLSNGKKTIPIAFKFWKHKQKASEYKKKTEIAKELILEIIQKLSCKSFLLDGAYASAEIMNLMEDLGCKYTMRIAKNRIIKTDDGEKNQLKNHSKFKMIRNQKYKSIKAEYKGRIRNFIAHKRLKKRKNEHETIFIVTNNINKTPKEYAKTYYMRWKIEKLFRTSKQSFGIGDCQATSIKKQQLHILSAFAAYTILNSKKNCLIKIKPEKILRKIRGQKLHILNAKNSLWEHTYGN